ncbi:hypothetical protein DIRU0_A05600 [Diutina rugosa]
MVKVKPTLANKSQRQLGTALISALFSDTDFCVVIARDYTTHGLGLDSISRSCRISAINNRQTRLVRGQRQVPRYHSSTKIDRSIYDSPEGANQHTVGSNPTILDPRPKLNVNLVLAC